MMKIRLLQILEGLVSRKSKGLQYYSGQNKGNNPVHIKEKGEIQTKLM